jgi:hypothetical protein
MQEVEKEGMVVLEVMLGEDRINTLEAVVVLVVIWEKEVMVLQEIHQMIKKEVKMDKVVVAAEVVLVMMTAEEEVV